MSEESYQHNLRRRVTGEDYATCLLASYDRISRKVGLSPQTYQRYEDLRLKFVDLCGDDANYVPQDLARQWSDLKEDFRRELGVPTPRNIISTHVRSSSDLLSILERTCQGNFRPAVYLDTGGLHAVGVIRVQRGIYRARSTWTPFDDEDNVTVEELASWLNRPLRMRKRPTNSRKTSPRTNFVALPPERR